MISAPKRIRGTVSLGGGQLSASVPYVDLRAPCPQDPRGRTFAQLIGKQAHALLARDPSGGIHDLLQKDRVRRALKRAGLPLPERTKPSPSHQQRRRRRELALRKKVVEQALPQIAARTEERAHEVAIWRMVSEGLARMLLASDGKAVAQVRRRRGIVSGAKAFARQLREMQIADLFGLLIELNLAQNALSFSGYSQAFRTACMTLGLDLKALEKTAHSTHPTKQGKPEKL